MTPAELIAAFESLAEAPLGIAQLRRLILQLAVQGRLVPQDAREGAGSKLLDSLPGEVARLAASGLVRKVEQFPQPLPGSLGFSLPSNWSVASLGNVALVLDHLREPVKAAEREARCVGKPQASLYPYFGATQQQGWIDDYRLEGEFVLLGEDGVPFLDPLRDKAYLVSGRVWVNNHAHVLLGVQFSNRFLLHYLNQFNYSGRVTGTTRAKLTKGDLVDIPVPVPPLAEQQRIVARVEELMGLLDRLEASRTKREAIRAAARDSVLAALREADSPEAVDAAWTRFAQRMDDLLSDPADIAPLRQTVLQLAVRGRLVRQDPKDEPAILLLDRITASKQHLAVAGKIAKCRPRTPVAAADRLAGLPESWVWCRLGDVLVDIEGGWSPAALGRPREGEEWGVLKVSACSWGRFLPDENKALAPGTVPREHLEVRSGDFLISRANTAELVARSVVVGVCPPRLMLSDKTLRMKPADGVVVAYLNLANLSAYARAQYEARASGTSASMKNVAQEVIRELVIPLPPAAEQLRIVARINELMGLLDRLERRLTAAKATQAAFGGAAVHHVVA
jgi:type I restriction enzyme S subunit